MPAVSEKQRRAMAAAAKGESNIGIPKSVGKEFLDADKGGKLPERKRARLHDHEGSPTMPHLTIADAASRTGTMADKTKRKKWVKDSRLDAKERRSLPRSDFALPGKGEGPQGKGSGSYPIPDKSHARAALSMVAAHGTAAEKKRVRAAVARKYPDIEQSDRKSKLHDHERSPGRK